MISSNMGYLKMVEAKLPPGFRFHPRDDELICDYLAPYKLLSDNSSNIIGNGLFPILIDIDLNKCEPWDLPDIACVGSKEWYFFNLRDRKYATGQRTNRATISGYWKATGKDRQIQRKGAVVGMRKTLVFYQGRAPKGKKTDWVMHEFRSQEQGLENQPPLVSCKEDWVLCRVFYKTRGMSTSTTATSSKPLMKESSTMEEDTCSSSLPSLNDQTYNALLNNNYFSPMMNVNIASTSTEQVPCFSNCMPQNNYPLMQDVNNSSSCGFKSLLDFQFNKNKLKEDHIPSSESCFPTAGSSSMWYTNFQS